MGTAKLGPPANEERASALINPLWHGAVEVTMRRPDLQAVLLHYGARYLHMRAGVGHHLKSRYLGAGVYSVWLEPAHAR